MTSGRLASHPDANKAQIMSKADQQRDHKLAAALRENLRRRKAQAREVEPRETPDSQTRDDTQAASE
jgi:hypothetical protein